MNLTFQAPVSSGMWTVTDDLGNKYPFKVRWDAAVSCCCRVGAGVGPGPVFGPLTVQHCATAVACLLGCQWVCAVCCSCVWLAGQYGDQGHQA